VQASKPDVFLRSRHYVAPRIQALQTLVLSASRAAISFSCQLASARLSFLRQHAVDGSAVLSAAALAEMATAAVKLVHEDGGSSGSSTALAALAVSAMPRLAACDVLNTTVSQDGDICIVTTDGTAVAAAHAAAAVHLDSQATPTAIGAYRKQSTAPGPLARIVRTSPLLADAAAPSRPLAALRLSPGAGDGFWVHPGLLSAALVLTDAIEQPAAGSAHLLLAVDCWSAGNADTADIHTSQQHHASLQVDLHHYPCLMSLSSGNRQHASASASCVSDMTIIFQYLTSKA
jgi:Polyketide synthase dehydratase